MQTKLYKDKLTVIRHQNPDNWYVRELLDNNCFPDKLPHKDVIDVMLQLGISPDQLISFLKSRW